jgi:hypothetical protein
MKRIAIAALAGLCLGACTSTRVMNVPDSPIGVDVPDQDIPRRIERALYATGWQVSARHPGEIDAFIVVRGRRAEISIGYDDDSYNIKYRDSRKLDYSHGWIHRNYNRWIANLDAEIHRQLAWPQH